MITRRRLLALLATAPFAAATVGMMGRLRSGASPQPVRLPPDLPVGLTIAGDLVLHRSADGHLSAFPARCTHLGCRLERVVDGMIVCSCHGSRFHSDGQVAAGPAIRPLPKLAVTPDTQTGGWIVHAG